jgi:hypothetical protein
LGGWDGEVFGSTCFEKGRPTLCGCRMILQARTGTSRPNPSPLYTGERMGEGLEHELRNQVSVAQRSPSPRLSPEYRGEE